MGVRPTSEVQELWRKGPLLIPDALPAFWLNFPPNQTNRIQQLVLKPLSKRNSQRKHILWQAYPSCTMGTPAWGPSMRPRPFKQQMPTLPPLATKQRPLWMASLGLIVEMVQDKGGGWSFYCHCRSSCEVRTRRAPDEGLRSHWVTPRVSWLVTLWKFTELRTLPPRETPPFLPAFKNVRKNVWGASQTATATDKRLTLSKILILFRALIFSLQTRRNLKERIDATLALVPTPTLIAGVSS